MQVGHFPAGAASSLIQGYCDDFVSLATILAQTLEQVSMRGISLEHSQPPLERIERGMRELADAIRELLDRGQVTAGLPAVRGKEGRPKEAAASSTRSAVRPPAAARPPAAHAPPQHHAPTRHAEALRGTSQSMPLLSVFQFLGRMRKAGTMRVQIGSEHMVFELQNGCVLVATSDHCALNERLGDLLVEHEACTLEQLAPILAKVDAGASERLGQLAIHAGIVKTEQVLAALEVQARRRFTRACKASNAAYEFVEEVRATTESAFRIPPMAIA